MNFPDNARYAKSHEWLRTEGTTAYIGISDYAQSELGDIVFVDITASVGDELQAGESFGTVEAVKTVSDVYMPVGGKVIEVNSVISDSPETINSDPFGDGWMIKIEPSDDNPDLMAASDYQSLVGGH